MFSNMWVSQHSDNTEQVSVLIESNDSSLKEKMWKPETMEQFPFMLHDSQRLVLHSIPISKPRGNFKVKVKKWQVVKRERV